MGGLEEVGKWVGGNTKAAVLALNPARGGFSLGNSSRMDGYGGTGGHWWDVGRG